MRVDPSTDIRDFLISRRARVSPEQAGLPDFGYGGKRRVQGLRREEVAMLSGISVEYYTRLERGKATGVSHEVLDAIAARCSSMTPSAPTSSTWYAPQQRAAPPAARARCASARPSSEFSSTPPNPHRPPTTPSNSSLPGPPHPPKNPTPTRAR
jgi:hypothetical protein